MNILIIGSEGFIGSHACSYFQKKRNVSLFKCGINNTVSDSNYFKVSSFSSNYNVVFQKEKFDVCINASGAADVYKSIQNPAVDYELNTSNVFKILDAIRRFNPACSFINLSSAAIYGNPQKLPISETTIPNPLSPYGWHKLQSEYMCKEFADVYGVKSCSLRIFSAFGIGLRKQIFWDLYNKSMKSKKIELWGTGKESRDYIYIDDLVSVMDIVIQNAKFRGEVINVGNGHEILIQDVAKIFFDTLNWRGEYYFKGILRGGDPSNWKADISAIKKMGYKQSVTFEEGVKKYVQWLKENESH